MATKKEDEQEKKRREALLSPVMAPGAPTGIETPGVVQQTVAPAQSPSPAPTGRFDHIFGPDSQAAYQARNTAYQDMLNQRKQTVQQQRTDDVKMAKYNALGNLITSMVQPIGWGIGGGASASGTAGVQPYDERQYLAAFNRAVKANDDLRNIGSADAEYQFKLADEAYQRAIAREDEDRRRQQRVEDSERQINYQLEKQQRQFEHQMEMQEKKDEARRALEEFKASHRVSRKGTGLTIDDRLLLKELDAYNAYVARMEAQKLPFDSFEKWADTHGYNVDRVRPTSTSTSSSSSTSPVAPWVKQ